MRHYAALLLAVLGAGCWQEAASQSYDEVLYSDNGMPWWGEYGDFDGCPGGSSYNSSFTYALNFKYDDLDDLDFIGGDSVQLFCRDDAGVTTGYITSLQGSHGEWQGIRSCPGNEYFTGFRLRVYPDQGTFGDDFAVDNIQLSCSDGTVVDGLDGVTIPAPDLSNTRDEEDETRLMRKWVEMMGRRIEVVRSGAECLQDAATWYYDEILYADNGWAYAGAFGDPDFCPYSSSGNDTFAFALDFKYDDLDDLDFIAGDSVKLFCRDGDGVTSGYVSSLEGSHGEWQGIRSCPANEYFIGFRLRVYPEQGTFGDDFAVDNIQLACSDGTVVDGLDGVTPPAPYLDDTREDTDEEKVVRKWVEIKGRWAEVVRQRSGAETKLNGNWGTFVYCSPGLYVMGIQTFVDEGSIGDDYGLTDVRLYCS